MREDGVRGGGKDRRRFRKAKATRPPCRAYLVAQTSQAAHGHPKPNQRGGATAAQRVEPCPAAAQRSKKTRILVGCSVFRREIWTVVSV